MANQTKKPFVFKRITSMMIAAVMTATTCITAVPMAAYAEDSLVEWDSANTAVSAEWDGSIATMFAGGKGTAAEPYLVADGSQLALIASETSNNNSFGGVHFKLTKDILLNDDINTNANIWTPIGSYSTQFQGVFDGNGHKIIGMVLPEYGYSGLFSYIGSSGTVKNVTTSGSSVNLYSRSGNICGYNYGTISNCTNSNSITTLGSEIGGICGFTYYGTIEKCKNTGSFSFASSSASYIGGISGKNFDGTISECSNSGKLVTTLSNCFLGGICGQLDKSNGKIENCNNSGTISGIGTGYGGICATVGDRSTISNCYNTASIKGSGTVGGISSYIGYVSKIINCYNTGTLSGDEGVGGVCGTTDDEVYIFGNYNTGKVNGTSSVGGVVGQFCGGKIANSFNRGAISGTSNVGGIVGLSYYKYSGARYLEFCYNSGTATASGDCVGGLFGKVLSATAVKGLYNTGNVSGASYVGGLWGDSTNSGNSFAECYSTCDVKGTGSYIYPVGNTVGTINKVFYDSDRCSVQYFSNAAYAKSTTELTAATAITDLGFSEDVWNKKTNTAYYLFYPDLAALDNDNPKFVKAVPTPENLKASAGNGQVTLTWKAVDEATKYAVYYYYNNEYVLVNSNITSPKYTVTGLKNGEKYGFKVKAYANNMWSATSSMVYATPAKPNIVPQNVAAKAGNGQATITWSAVSGATKYSVYKYANGAYTLLSDSIKATSYTATGLTNGTKYGFKVKAYVGEWSAASALVYATPVGSTVPENLRIANGDGKVRVLWDKVAGATKYAVYSYLDGKYTTETTSVTATNYTVTGLTNGTKYGFKVKAYVGGKWSAASAIIYARPSASTAPGAIKAIAGNKSAEVKWSGVIGATKYAVYKYENGVYTCVNSNITDIKYTVTGLTNGKQYGFKVKAYVNGAWSAASVIAYATPTA